MAAAVAIYQLEEYGNPAEMAKRQKKKVDEWINQELGGDNYGESKLLEDYLHLRNEHKDDFEEIHRHFSVAMDKEIKPDDDFQDSYYCYHKGGGQKEDIDIMALLDEIQLHFGGIFDSAFFHQKYKMMEQIGDGIEGTVHKIKLKPRFETFAIREEEDGDDDGDDVKVDNVGDNSSDDDEDGNALLFAAKTIEYNERTMNNYRLS